MSSILEIYAQCKLSKSRAVYPYKTRRYYSKEVKTLVQSVLLHTIAAKVLTEATKNGKACQNGESRRDAANICCIDGSPIEWPKLSSTMIAAYIVALESSDIQ